MAEYDIDVVDMAILHTISKHETYQQEIAARLPLSKSVTTVSRRLEKLAGKELIETSLEHAENLNTERTGLMTTYKPTKEGHDVVKNYRISPEDGQVKHKDEIRSWIKPYVYFEGGYHESN